VTSATEPKPFEVQLAPDRVLLRVQPALDGGRKASLGDIQKELERLGVKYRPDTLLAIYRRARNEFEPLALRDVVDLTVQVAVSDDQQTAHMLVVGPPGSAVSPDAVKTALSQARVTKGLLVNDLRRVIAQRLMGQKVLIAKGRPAQNGENGRVDFVVTGEDKAETGDNESVNWRERNLIRGAEEGELVARVFLPTAGLDGYTVTGRVLRARDGRKARYLLGSNVTQSENGMELFAAKAGYVVQSGDRISIEDVYVAQDVNSATGNVHFAGVVSVRGNVEDTFRVEASKGVDVGKTVGQAVIVCGGDVTISGGVMGATIEAKGNISARFFSGCTLRAGGDILAVDYILHGTAEAEGSVRVSNTLEGFISGGTVRARREISAAVLGSSKSEEITHLEAGGGASVRSHHDRLVAQIKSGREAFERLRRNAAFLQEGRLAGGPLPEAKREIMDQAVAEALQVRDGLFKDAKTYHAIQAVLEKATGPARPVILAANLVNAGVQVQVLRHALRVKTPLKACANMFIDGQLKPHDYDFVVDLLKQLSRQD
jgi:uncharacterized protein (DUF342 family)